MVSKCAYCGPLLTNEPHKPDCPSAVRAAILVSSRPDLTMVGKGVTALDAANAIAAAAAIRARGEGDG